MPDTSPREKFSEGVDAQIQVGSLAVAQRQTGVCSPCEVGVCYDLQRIGEQPIYFFVFESGGYDGFDPEEIASMLDLTGWTCEAVAGYRFQNVTQLERDYRSGLFAPAFPPAPASPPPRTAPPRSAEANP